MACANIIVFPVRHRGDPEPRRFALVTLGFRWREGAWRRGRVVLTDADLDTMVAPVWERRLRRWTTRRPRAHR
jgi:hypothetical protein